ncbi:hypothetical protein [Pandoraea commovens]|uniref:Protein-tyrosine-phosphatase n=1 Tax=Pandoraea commovens TaxID=2508289 RepID=A0ABY5QGE3_9BURK|nr:hypothetical protein [Pandoraea commovens]UVA79714.1 hypothetical protein NTU39_01335 [Pandoraea commovens]
MTSISLQSVAYNSRPTLDRLGEPGNGATIENGRIGINDKGQLVVFKGRTYLLHLQQCYRADKLIKATFVTDFSVYSTTLRTSASEATFSVLHAPYRHAPDVPSDRLYVTQTLQFVENAMRHVSPPDDASGKSIGGIPNGYPVIVFDEPEGIAGVLVAALAMSRDVHEHLSVEEIVTDIRLTASPHLIGTHHQLDVIGAFADDLRRPLLRHR